MSYLAVTGVVNMKPECLFHCICITDDYTVHSDFGNITEKVLIDTVISNSLTPINFSISRERRLVMDCGDFSRFSTRGSAVILAELVTRGSKVLGYKLLSCAKPVVTNLKLDEILLRDAAYGEGEHFLQNGIIRNKTVNCYPRKPFNRIVVYDSNKKPVKKEEVKPAPRKAVEKPQKTPKPDVSAFTPEQLKELTMCKANGVNPRFITNPKLSPQQMRVLWVSKSKGAYSESFANPKMSVDVMKFYADRILSASDANECKELLAHPELGVPELSELYACICEGVPYKSYIGKDANTINVLRMEKVANYWGSSRAFDTDYFDKASNVARKIRGY